MREAEGAGAEVEEKVEQKEEVEGHREDRAGAVEIGSHGA